MSENNTSNKPKVTAIPKNVPFGLCLWELPSGSYLGNANGEFLSVGVNMNDIPEMQRRMRRLADEAAVLGYPDGKPVFRPGLQKVTQSEYEDQMAQLLDGEEVEGDLDA